MSTEPGTTSATLRAVARDLAGTCARTYDDHIRAHGPDSSEVMRESGSSRYLVGETMTGGSIAFIKRDGEWFAVHVYPVKGSALASFEPRPEGYEG